ncbi:hypothetical protein WJX74_008594 [Apatococcus lobatus]|uniref:Uncharacterized protein n=1 Tax=Apatococcus lobatus TaxID=904363 RepID=A0AAW1Q782_9CHLO
MSVREISPREGDHVPDVDQIAPNEAASTATGSPAPAVPLERQAVHSLPALDTIPEMCETPPPDEQGPSSVASPVQPTSEQWAAVPRKKRKYTHTVDLLACRTVESKLVVLSQHPDAAALASHPMYKRLSQQAFYVGLSEKDAEYLLDLTPQPRRLRLACHLLHVVETNSFSKEKLGGHCLAICDHMLEEYGDLFPGGHLVLSRRYLPDWWRHAEDTSADAADSLADQEWVWEVVMRSVPKRVRRMLAYLSTLDRMLVLEGDGDRESEEMFERICKAWHLEFDRDFVSGVHSAPVDPASPSSSNQN